MIENEGLRILRRLTDEDVEFIELLQDKGQVSSMWMKANDKWREVLKRCKARSIVVPVRKADNYWYDLTDFGFNLYTLIQAKRKEGTLNTVTPRPKEQEKPLLQL
jgi:6-phosphogluconate dehydrogenase